MQSFEGTRMLTKDEELEERLIKRQIELLEKASPECWHCVAVNHNWNDQLDILYWIVAQDKCDKATALLIFWRGEPTCYNFGDCTEEMGESSYSVEPMLKYIIRRFNGIGYQRSEIAFDIWVAKTGSGRSDPHGILPESYYSSVEAGIRVDFDELIELRGHTSDPTLKVPDDMLQCSVPGYDVSEFDDVWDFYYAFPLGVNYDTSEFVYDDRPSDNEDQIQSSSHDEVGTASSHIRALRNQARLTETSYTNNSDQRDSRVYQSVKAKAGLWNIEREETWFFFHVISIGCCLIALSAFTSEKFYSTIGWVASTVLILWECWSAFSSFKSFDQSVSLKKLFGSLALGLLSGILLSLPAFACIVIIKSSFGSVIGSLIAIAAMLPLVWIISIIYDKAYLKSAS
jgi:hypothetical protein